jgi:FdhE protein
MAQRILEPGQIETLAQRSIPRVRLPDRTALFSRRAARLRELAPASSIRGYLELLAVIAQAQQRALDALDATSPTAAQLSSAAAHGMPPLHAPTWTRTAGWHDTLESLCAAVAAHPAFPEGVKETTAAIRGAARAWLEAQAQAMLEEEIDAVEPTAAPFVMAALQVHWVGLAGGLADGEVEPQDVPGVCPVCGMLPVASLVCAQSPYQGYRYLHCALCSTEWHLVRVQCSLCGASGPDIAYHSVDVSDAREGTAGEHPGSTAAGGAVRAETCERCRGYRKIFYQEQDTRIEPMADDVASVALDLLLGERGYHRASSNPLLWLSNAQSVA